MNLCVSRQAKNTVDHAKLGHPSVLRPDAGDGARLRGRLRTCRVNAIAPGFIETELSRASPPSSRTQPRRCRNRLVATLLGRTAAATVSGHALAYLESSHPSIELSCPQAALRSPLRSEAPG